MNGSIVLSDEEKHEMLMDANNSLRKEAFLEARLNSQGGGLDDYIEFLSKNMGISPNQPVKRITDDFRL